MRRRALLQSFALSPLLLPGEEKLPPIRALTRGPTFHWFGYYDKLEFDPTSRFVLGMESGFENRTPQGDDAIRIGMIDLENGDPWKELGSTSAWSWQQGCMLQWLPGSRTEVIYNDRQDDQFVSHILDVKSGRRRSLPMPVYGISPDATWAVCPDFRRLHDTRPGYGYAGITDPNQKVNAPDDAGIWWQDLRTGKHELIIPISKAAAIASPHAEMDGAKHWFNHLLVAPDGKRFIFLHRWQKPGAGSFMTRMFTANPDGTDLRVVDPYGYTSHFKPLSPEYIEAQRRHGDGRNEVALHINPVSYPELRYILERSGFQVVGIYRDRPKRLLWLYAPLVWLIRLVGWLTPSGKRRQRWTDELQSDAVLLGGNTLIVHATRL